MSGRNRSEFKEEEIFQAVVIADSFNTRFDPLTLDRPQTLLPLVNVPLLEYTLEFLSYGGVQEVILFCSSHSNQIKSYLSESRWFTPGCSMKVVPMVSEGCLSVGDALRDLDNKSLIRSDFVLVNGDIVSNVKLKPILEEHRKRRTASKNALMTMVFKEAPPGHTSRNSEDDALLAIHANTKRIISYQKVNSSKKFTLPLELFETSNVELHYDLLNCHISICSPVVLQLMTDNFDYQTLDDFIRGILINEEVLGNTIHLSTINDSYSARVLNMRMYEAVSKDIMDRWTYPMVPDYNILGEPEEEYEYGHRNIYLQNDVTLASCCNLIRNVVIGGGSILGENTVISDSVIGKNCRIGSGVKITRCYIWDDAVIEDGAELNATILDVGVTIRKEATILSGCILGKGVVIESRVSVPARTKLVSSHSNKSETLDKISEQAFKYTSSRSCTDETREEQDELGSWGTKLVQIEMEQSSSSESEEEEEEVNESERFYEEMTSDLERAIQENISTDNVILEINSVKAAYGIQIREVTMLLAKALLELPLKSATAIDGNVYLSKFKGMMKRFFPLFRNYVKTEQSERDALMSMEELASMNGTVLSVLPSLVKFLYDSDALTEEGILGWWRMTDDKAEHSQKVRDKMVGLIQWLETAEEDSESD